MITHKNTETRFVKSGQKFISGGKSMSFPVPDRNRAILQHEDSNSALRPKSIKKTIKVVPLHRLLQVYILNDKELTTAVLTYPDFKVRIKFF